MRPSIPALLILLPIGMSAVPIAEAVTPFVPALVDSVGNTGAYCSVAIDDRGGIHISYYDNTNFDLKYARSWNGGWTTETVDASGAVGDYTSIAVDRAGRPHISYHAATGSALKYAVKVGGVWQIETADATAGSGYYSSIALDSHGRPYIAHYNNVSNDLILSEKPAASWISTTVDATGNVGEWPSLALTAQDRPVVGYYYRDNGTLKVAARKSDGAWLFDNADGFPNDRGQYASLTLDSQGAIHLSYWDAVADDLYYTTNKSGDWQDEAVDTNGTVGQWTSITVDPLGTVCIAYRNRTDFALWLATGTAGNWTTELVDAGGFGTGLSTAMTLDTHGNPVIAFQRDKDLRVADSGIRLLSPLGGDFWPTESEQAVRWRGAGPIRMELSTDGGFSYSPLVGGVTRQTLTVTVPDAATEEARIRIVRESPHSVSESPGFFTIAPDMESPWWIEVADNSPNTGSNSSIAIGTDGKPVVAFYRLFSFDLMFATRASGTWTLEEVDAAGTVGATPSLAVGPDNVPHVAYQHGGNLDLKYAIKPDSVWQVETVDNGAQVGYYPSLVLDNAAVPLVCYYDGLTDDLRFASRAGGSWATELVDGTGDVGRYPSLALDPSGTPHISYWDLSNLDLKYAAKVGGTWTVEVVDASPAGGFSSLQVDRSGTSHISYYSSAGDGLKYARGTPGNWTIEFVDRGFVGSHTSLTIDDSGNPCISYRALGDPGLRFARRTGGVWSVHVIESGAVGESGGMVMDSQGKAHLSYYDADRDVLKYATNSIALASPAVGSVWPVGASRTVGWDGPGRMHLSLSVDGGNSWTPMATGLTGGFHQVNVPHQPTAFARLRLERDIPRAVSVSELFVIQSSIELLNLSASLLPEGVQLEWASDPGPEDLEGYRIERRHQGRGEWDPVVPLTRETAYLDPRGGPAHRYRVSAINRLGDALILGEAGLPATAILTASPNPYRSGDMTIRFQVFGALGGSHGEAEVDLFDVRGRRVRRIAAGNFEGASQIVFWNGLDDRGAPVPSGIYFLRLRTAGHESRAKLVVVP